MFSPDCICVCSFSTTSPFLIRSCVTLMPVISLKALASTLDSYSCVVIVSETTLISMPAKGFAALMNHSISFLVGACDSVDRLDLGVDPRLRAPPCRQRRGPPASIRANAPTELIR
jgi:hypothetical protein